MGVIDNVLVPVLGDAFYHNQDILINNELKTKVLHRIFKVFLCGRTKYHRKLGLGRNNCPKSKCKGVGLSRSF